ncbi:MAG: peptidoglycan DD-metalloendopeptidase family protein [Pseudomonadota bacterium]
MSGSKHRGATAVRDGQGDKSRMPLPLRYPLAVVVVVSLVSLVSVLAPKQDSSEGEAHVIAPPTRVPSATPPEPVAVAPAPVSEPWEEQLVGAGDNLSIIFQRAGYDSKDVHDVVSQAQEGKSLARIYPGQTIAFSSADDGTLAAVRHVRSELETVVYRRDGNAFVSSIETRSPQVRDAWATGVITSSLFLAGQEAGLSQNTIMELANIFGGVIDFVLDPRRGDTIQLLYQDLYLDGEKYADGDIIAATFTNRGETFRAYRYTDSQGETGYFNEDGVSMRKAFLLAPVDFTRISSNFDLRRLHPIYKTTRPHRGTDYAAPRGTPVYAAGDGRVTKSGYSKANGNYVFIKHGEQYITKYLHLHKRHVKTGQRVSQSQVIGTVGATGAATGPHLHYEFLVNGVHRNPRTIHKQLPKAESLPNSEIERFRASIRQTSEQLAALTQDNRYAMSESASAKGEQR